MKLITRVTGFGAAGSERGFTLIELMVASVVFVVAVGVLLSFLRRDEKAREISSHVIESRQNARAALDFIVSEIRMAGSGVSRPVVTSDGGTGTLILYPVTPDSINGRREKLTLIEKTSDIETTLRTQMSTASTLISANNVGGFSEGDLVVVTDGSSADLFEVTQVDAGAKTLQHSASSPYNQPAGHVPWPGGGYRQGSSVIKVDVITYYVDRTDTTCATIMRKVGTGDARVISEFVNAMELQYELQDHTVVEAPPDPMLIRRVIVTIEARSDEASRPHLTRLVSAARPRCL